MRTPKALRLLSILALVLTFLLTGWQVLAQVQPAKPAEVAPAAPQANPLFNTPRAFGNLEKTTGMAVGEFTGDGFLDVLVSNEAIIHISPGSFQLFANNGQGQLELRLTIASPGGGVYAGDFNHDGALDFMGDNQLYLNNGSGEFLAQTTNITGAGPAAVGDVNGDGFLDFVIQNELTSTAVYLNNGLGTFGTPIFYAQPEPGFIVLGDLNGDRRLDMVTGNAVYHNTGPSFNLITTLNTTGPLALGDVNDDGSLDIVMGVYDDFNAIYFNNGTGGFHPAPNQNFGRFKDYTTSVELADLNGDGYTDIMTSHENNRPSKYFLNNGFGEFIQEYAFGGEYDNSAVSLADLDNNGTLDAIVTVKERPNFYYLNEGGGGFSFNIPLAETGYSRDVALGDIDGDGLLDIVVANYAEDSFIYYNQGAWFAEPEQFALNDLIGPQPDPELALAVAIADLDGDTDLEILIGGEVSYIYHPENETFTPLLFPPNTTDLEVGDFNNDYALDIFVGTNSEDLIYLNDGAGGFGPTADVVLPILDLTDVVAVGDLNGDGYLDLITGNYGSADYLFLNNGDGTFAEGTQIGGFHNTTSVAVGDLDGDGDLDLVMGYDREQHYVFFNDGLGEFPTHHAFGDADRVLDLALSDLDRDGDLDLVSANLERFNFTYINPGTGRFGNGSPLFGRDDTFAIAVGDLDGDSFGDVVVANGGTPNFWHSNGYRLSSSLDNNPPIIFVNRPVDTYDAPGFSSPELVDSQFITIPYVVADYEGDPIGQVKGYYSLDGGDNWQPAVAGNMTPQTNLPSQLMTQDFPGQVIHPGQVITRELTFPGGPTALFEPEIGLHINHSNTTQLSAALVTSWPEEEGGTTIRLFENLKGGSPGNTRIILSDAADIDIQSTTAVYTFTTYNSNNVPITITSNLNSIITSTLVITGGPTSIVDVNVINLMGTHTYMEDLTMWLQSPSGTIIELVEEICEDDDNFHLNFDDEAQGWDIPCPPTTNGVYRPQEPLFLFDGEDSNGVWKLIIEDDADGDGGSLQSWGLKITSAQANTQGNALPLSGTFRPIDPLYTLNGAPSNITYTLVITKSNPPIPPQSPDTLHMWNIHSTGREHIFMWDTFASGFFGESNNVVFRLEAYAQSQPVAPGLYHYHNSTGGNSQWVYASDTTYPFTARGTQVLVTYEGEPVENALVYRLPAGQTSGATPLANTAGVPFVTDEDGYLQGRGVLAVGDQLMALAPIDASDTVTFTDRYRLYYTSAPINPTTNAPDLYTVNGWGVHELAVSEQNTLTLFDIDLSLEWDARQDPTFLEQLEQDIARASEVLYDVTNGQVALGEVNIYQAKENWTFSHAVVYAANDLRPSANAGGIVYTVTAEVISPTAVITDAYLPGQVRMGPTWGRFGDPGSNLGEDWPRAFAHELAHYFFFLPDNYLGVENGQVVPTECYGSFMTDAYSDEYTEFLDESGWTEDCLQTIAETITGRDDWATVQTYWPWLRIDPLVSGPALLPLAVTEITQIEPAVEDNSLDVPFFSLRDASGQPILIPAGQGQAYLFKNADTPAAEDDYVVALGTPSGDLVHARGAKPGDRLCVYNYGVDPTQLGCLTIGNTEGNLTLLSLGEWQPEIIVSAQNSVTLGITVTQATTRSVYVQVLPATGFTETFPITSPVAMLTPVVGESNTYATVVNMPYPAANGYVRVWAESAETKEAITQFMLSSGFGVNRSGFDVNRSGFDVNRSGFDAPIASNDGKVRIYNVTDIFADTGTLSLQALNESPVIPSWLTLAGQAYRFQSSALFNRSITFEYLQSSVPGGRVYEHVLRIYYSPDEGESWQRLNTRLDTDHNFASAVMPETNNGDGLYMLAATLDMPMLDEGWNLLAYPVPFTRTLPLAVESLGNSYTTIYNNGPTAVEPWQLYDRIIAEEHPELAELVNTLTYVEFGGVYWIYATEAITPYIGLPPEQRLNSVGFELPPATYYGWITPTETFTATAGMTVTAMVDGQLCGETVVQEWQGRLAYRLQVLADNGNGCGATGRVVTFWVSNQQMGHNQLWGNTQAWYHPLLYLAGEIQGTVYLPVLIRP